MSERIRLTISVTPEVHAVFTAMAEAGGISLGKCMGDWLADTAEGAQFVALKMQQARKAPADVMREMQAMAAGLHEAIGAEIGVMRPAERAEGAPLAGRGREGKRAAKQGAGSSGPPCSPTGVKSPTVKKVDGGKGGSKRSVASAKVPGYGL